MFHTDDEFLREIERQPAERTLQLAARVGSPVGW
jgi:hypothetical protein